MGKILVSGLEYLAFHGFFPEEQKIGGKYIVDVEIETDFSKAVKDDTLEGTVNYAEIVGVVGAEMKINSKLLEHVAGRILDKLMSNIPEIRFARVKVTKINPPLETQLKSVSVILEKRR